jgi:hypothetical protein
MFMTTDTNPNVVTTVTPSSALDIIATLQAERETCVSKIASIDAQFAAIRGAVPGQRKKRTVKVTPTKSTTK